MGSDLTLPTSAHDYIEVLGATLPQLQFHAYVAREVTGEPLNLYFFAFITSKVLIGGYTMLSDADDSMFPSRIMSLAQFFRRAWEEEVPRFYPQELQTLYEAHRDSGTLWQRVA